MDSYGKPLSESPKLTAVLIDGPSCSRLKRRRRRTHMKDSIWPTRPRTSFGSHTLTEWVFIMISLLVAGIGIVWAVLFYVKNPRLPDIWAARLRPLYDASYNKYWVDEFYRLGGHAAHDGSGAQRFLRLTRRWLMER